MNAKFLVSLITTAVIGCAALPAMAATPVKQEPGVSGFFRLGVGVVEAKTNMLATTFGGNAELGDDKIDDPTQDPDSKSSVVALPSLSVTYTFENKATELFFGSSIEDFLSFDFATNIGVRHQVGGVGIFEVTALATPLATEVWEDPYVANVKRDKTDRETNGIRLEWGQIMGSNFDLRVSTQKVDLDKESSGDALVAANVITRAEQDSLDRNGDINIVGVNYRWKISTERRMDFTVNSVDYDLDGGAMAYDGYSVKVSYLGKVGERSYFSGNVFFGSYDYDDENPIADKTANADIAGIGGSYILDDPFGWKDWKADIIAVYANDNNNIDFYDSTASLVSVGLLRLF